MTDGYLRFDRDAWSKLRASTPLTLVESDLDALRAIGDHLSLDEVERCYLPLSRLLNLHVTTRQSLRAVTSTFIRAGADQFSCRRFERSMNQRWWSNGAR